MGANKWKHQQIQAQRLNTNMYAIILYKKQIPVHEQTNKNWVPSLQLTFMFYIS